MAKTAIRRRLMLGALPLLAAPALAQGRPVTLVVPFPPGGSTDVMARLLADRMAPALGTNVVVENRPGGATVVGAEAVARAAPDGMTVLVNSGTTLTLNPLLMKSLSYKPEDFAAVSLLSTLPFAFLLKNSLPGDIDGFVAHAKARPGQLNYGTNGPSSFNNIAAVLVADALGIRMQDVTYRGDAQQLSAFLAGTLDLLVVGGASAIQPHRNGQGRIIGWTGDRRMPSLPDIPTFEEKVPGTVAQTYFGLVVPARTPRGPIERLSKAAAAALQTPELRERLLAEGQFAIGSGPEDFASFLQTEAARWRPVLAKMNLQIE
ncbi:tripartite tricarboxylate transporter substrate binding protein [Siccirubricoccus sp. KC 17139]|uniref:Tripartite tricarboxylate transporter substrate binding protein n=1 Tax=Siccirubricoccus soli TaxID=2899147 RepID=A0ABT1D1C4_9PROT|nr:tripartite tricarboxylate transporter substrate binding protein [Siccirubricoccus soli]MCO6415718.1 tripartite tricarboxylate transporter substrate binding protein [Siccirubricoccus soli]MCP2681850.1 tripartite tricarboxylate transporter substrate binding protein [Siccirubricoccus soli]